MTHDDNEGGPVRRRRASGMTVVVAALVVVASIATATVASAADGSGDGGDQAPAATDVGVTADEIRIAVLADVENDLQPGLFQGTPDAMQGFEKYINDQGGLAGRKLVVDFIDSHLDADDTRNAIIEACENDFAIVATTSLFVNNVDDMVNCVNANGAAVGLPDFPVLTTEPVHQCSPVSHPITPPALDCSTIDDHPQTYRANTGPTSYYLKKHGALSGVFLYPSDLKSAKNAQVPAFMAQKRKGVKVDAEYDLSARAQQSAYTPIAQQIKEDGTTYAAERPGLQLDHLAAQGGEAPGRQQRQGLGLLERVLHPAAAQAGRRRRRGPVRQRQLRPVLQRGEGEPDDAATSSSTRARTRSTASGPRPGPPGSTSVTR